MREIGRIIINKGAVMADLGVGDIAPGFELAKAGGGVGKLADVRGRPLVLFFFCKDGGDACVNEAKDFSRLKSEFDALGVAVIGISPDGAKTKERFRAKHGVTIDLLSDETRQTVRDYGVWTEKSMYGRSYMGVERTTFLIDPAGRIVRIWRKVRVGGHAEEALAAARMLDTPD
jgi:peroxiredoxin Q/BCP